MHQLAKLIKTYLLLLLSFLLVACAQPMSIPVQTKLPAAESLVWPTPPQPPRIRFINSIASPADLGIKSSLRKWLSQLLSGQQEDVRLVRPAGVVMQQEIIYVADPGAQSLWILNARSKEFKRIRNAGKVALVSPVAVAIGSSKQIFVADSYLARIFVYDDEGKHLATIGQGVLHRPAGLAFDAATNQLYVADSAAHRIWIYSGEDKSFGVIGRRGTGKGEFNFPTHVAVDANGILYVTDALGFRIQMFSRDGQFLNVFGHHGNASGDLAAPKGVAVDSEGHIYVVDALFDKIQIFDTTGQLLLSFGERGIATGQFWLPGGLFIDSNDHIYVADAYNQRIQIFKYLSGRK